MTTLSRFTQKISMLLGEKEKLSHSFLSSPRTQIKGMLQMHPLLNLLPYESYDKESGLYHNKGSVGFILEASPLTGASEETVTLLNSFIADSLPTGVIMQVILFASPKVGDKLERWQHLRHSHDKTFETLAQARVNYLTKSALQISNKNDAYLIRDFRLFISITAEENIAHESLIRLRDELISTLNTIHIQAENLKVERFISLLNDLIHPSNDLHSEVLRWDENTPLSHQVVSPEAHLEVREDSLTLNHHWDVRTFNVREFPSHFAQWGMQDLIGDMYREALRIPCSFLMSFALRIPDREKSERLATIKTLRSDQQTRSPLARFMPVAHKISRDWKVVSNRLEEGEKLVEGFYQVVLYAKKGEGERCETLLKNLYQAKGWKLGKPSYLQLQSWISSLPLSIGEWLWEDLKRFGRIKTLLSHNAANLLPLQGEWKGMMNPRMLLLGRRGQVLFWDNFSNVEGNYNVAVVGKSGSGKSVFMQELMTSLLSTGGRVWIIDIGRSFQKTCELLKGEFIEFTQDTHLCINPFTFITDFNEALALLKPLLSMMARPTTKTSDHENAFLEQALKFAWEKYKTESTVTHVAEWLLKHPDPRANDLGTMLFPYTRDGMYGKFFEGRCTLNLESSLTVLELEELKSKKDLQEVILLTLMYQVTEAMYRGKRDQPLACIIDEAWDMLRGEHGGTFVETGCRRARKYNGAFITGTQSVNDYYKTAAAKAAFENSDWLCLLSQKPESIDELKEKKRLHIDGHMERLLKSVKTIQGAYAEILIYGPPGYAIARLMLDPFSRILYSSKGEEFAAVKALQAQGLTLTEAIKKVAHRQ